MSKRRNRARTRVAVALLLAVSSIACSRGAPVRKTGPVTRVVCLDPAATETFFALGAGKMLVGRSSFGDEPPAACTLPVAGDATSVNAEKIVELSPDVVIVDGRAQEKSLASVSGLFRVITIRMDTVPEILHAVRRIGRLAGRNEAAVALTGRIRKAIESARARHEGRQGPKVLYVIQEEPLIVAGGPSYIGELLDAVGARNVAGDLERPWPTLSLEALLARDPDRIIDATYGPSGGQDKVRAFWSRFGNLAAVKNGRVETVPGNVLSRPGPRLPEALRLLERLVWGKR